MYSRYESKTPIGVMAFTNCFGVAIYEPEEEDRYKDNCDLIAAWTSTDSLTGFHKHKIHYTENGRSYIRKGSLRIYLDEVMRVA